MGAIPWRFESSRPHQPLGSPPEFGEGTGKRKPGGVTPGMRQSRPWGLCGCTETASEGRVGKRVSNHGLADGNASVAHSTRVRIPSTPPDCVPIARAADAQECERGGIGRRAALRRQWARPVRVRVSALAPPSGSQRAMRAPPARCARGEIGRRTGFRFPRRKAWRFDASRAHQSDRRAPPVQHDLAHVVESADTTPLKRVAPVA